MEALEKTHEETGLLLDWFEKILPIFYFPRYSCFVCDFDLCLECKTVWEERQAAKRAKAERRLRRNPRLSRAEVSNVVCLKTLCDTVAQIENARKNKVH